LLCAALTEVAADHWMWCLRARRPLNMRERADWLQDAACAVLKRIDVSVRALGDPPKLGLVVSNHLSYLDVLAYASVMPCCFVAKQEVRGWPVFGRFAMMAGTIFVDRERHGVNGGALAAMEDALSRGVPVVLFPEGTSSDGGAVLPFHSGFFEPAIRANAAVTPAAIGYSSEVADEAEIAYCGEDVFAPHLVRTLGLRGLEARVIFGTARRYAGRKEAARAAHIEVEALRGTMAGRRVDEEILTATG
jgi:1-acyl-sn-glycerol-3-phosphate acyltransferase